MQNSSAKKKEQRNYEFDKVEHYRHRAIDQATKSN